MYFYSYFYDTYLLNKISGLSEIKAKRCLTKHGYAMRVISINGIGLFVSSDMRENRLDVQLIDGKVFAPQLF